MQYLLLFNPDFRPFDPHAVERAIRSCAEFSKLQFNKPSGTRIECEYIEHDDWTTTIRLSENSERISLDSTSGAALKAVLLIQRSLGIPLRMVDDDNRFDLTFSNVASVEELEAAIENAQTS